MKFPETARQILLATILLISLPATGQAEPPAQSIHWGAIGYPDHDRTLALGLTVVDRFTEFDGAGNRYNDIRETMGFNFFSLSWTERLETFKGWNANFTAGGGPTRDGFSRFLQNDVIHKLRGFDPVPVGNKRETDDFMLSGSLTRWMSFWGSDDVFFAGVGAAGGSLYYEPYAQAGFRRLSPFAAVPWLSDHLRISAMGRVGRPFGGAAFGEVAATSWIAQGSATTPTGAVPAALHGKSSSRPRSTRAYSSTTKKRRWKSGLSPSPSATPPSRLKPGMT